MGSIDNQYVSQVRSMAQQAMDAQDYVYHNYNQQRLNWVSNDIYRDSEAGRLGACLLYTSKEEKEEEVKQEKKVAAPVEEIVVKSNVPTTVYSCLLYTSEET